MWDLTETVEYYKRQGAPDDQTALVSFLREIQHNEGAIPGGMLPQIARELGVRESFLLAVIKRIPSLRLADTHTLELCAGPNCPRRADLASFVEKTYGKDPKGFTVKYGPCMRLCGKGPNIKWDGQLYHRADETLLRNLLAAVSRIEEREEK